MPTKALTDLQQSASYRERGRPTKATRKAFGLMADFCRSWHIPWRVSQSHLQGTLAAANRYRVPPSHSAAVSLLRDP